MGGAPGGRGIHEEITFDRVLLRGLQPSEEANLFEHCGPATFTVGHKTKTFSSCRSSENILVDLLTTL